MTPVTTALPLDNMMCKIRVKPHLAQHGSLRKGVFRYVRESDGDYFWDNLVDEVLQHDEVTHWSPVSEGPSK